MLPASFSRAEKEEQVGGLGFGLWLGAWVWTLGGGWGCITGWFEVDCWFLKWELMVFGHGGAALNPGWRLEKLALPWAKIYNPYRVEFVPTPYPSRGGRGQFVF